MSVREVCPCEALMYEVDVELRKKDSITASHGTALPRRP